MPGSAILGDNLVDALIPDVVDGLRDSLNTDLGVRQFRMFVVTRTWALGLIGEGGYTDTEIEITPQPLVLPYVRVTTMGSGFRLEPAGVDDADVVKIQEVSMTYTEAELGSPGLPYGDGVEKFIRLEDAHGQGIPNTFWRHDSRPFNDRIKTMGWLLKLVPAVDLEC